MSFRLLGLKPELLQAISEMGFDAPMPIQKQAIPVLLEKETDFIGLAQTGTGKTGAYGLSLLQRLDPGRTMPQALILCPTRELCLQITGELRQFGTHLKGVRSAAVYGGASISGQMAEIRRGAQVVTATPGRLCDLMRRRAIDLAGVHVAVLDEADEMLNMGFQEDLDLILAALPAAARTWLFSATMPAGVAAIARKYLDDPVEITVGGRNQSAANLEHVVFPLQHAHRYVALKRLLDAEEAMFGLVFRRTRRETQELADALARDGYPSEALHGDLSQAQRDSVMRSFRRRQMRVLIATDVAARGLDVDDITHVIHYDLPDDLEVYTHRSGRTARAGKSGVSWVFAAPSEQHRLRALERSLRIAFTLGRVPDGRETCRRMLLAMASKLAATEVHPAALSEFLPPVTAVLETLSKDDLVARLTAAEIKRYHAMHGTMTDVNAAFAPAAEKRARGDARERPPAGDMRRFELNIGRRDRVHEGAIVRLVCAEAGIPSFMIGRIVMDDEFSGFEVQAHVAERVCRAMRRARFDGRPVLLREAGGERRSTAQPRAARGVAGGGSNRGHGRERSARKNPAGR